MTFPKILFFIHFVSYTVLNLSAEIEFIRDVKPILEHNCISCHREGNVKGGIRLDTKEAAFKPVMEVIVARQTRRQFSLLDYDFAIRRR